MCRAGEGADPGAGPPDPPALEFPEPIHGWFGLSYCNYLTIPRSVLQSMPVPWQARLVALLAEMDTACGAAGISWPRTEVRLRDGEGRYRPDPLADYERGRRNVFREGRGG